MNNPDYGDGRADSGCLKWIAAGIVFIIILFLREVYITIVTP